MTVQPVEADEQEHLRAETEADLAAAGVTPMSDERLRAPGQDSLWKTIGPLDRALKGLSTLATRPARDEGRRPSTP
jgi:hypothetical protein